jgi:predicted ATPase
MSKNPKKLPKVETLEMEKPKPEETASSQALGISSLKLQNIGPFDEQGLTINFGKKLNDKKANVHIFVGENGCGKSTLLKKYYSDKICNVDEHSNVKYFETKIPNFLFLLNENIEDYRNLIYDFPTLRYRLNGNEMMNISNAFFQEDITLNYYLNYIKNVWLDRSQAELYELSPVKRISASQYVEFKKKASIIETIENIINEIYGISYNYTYENNIFTTIINGKPVDYRQFSLGYKKLIGFLSHLLVILHESTYSNLKYKRHPTNYDFIDKDSFCNAKFTLLLDEIDIHLHPKAQRRILPALQSLFPNAEIFCTTHSPFVVNSVSEAWVYELKMENGKFIDDQTGEVLDEIGDKNPANKENYKNRRVSSDGDSYIFSVLEDFNISQLFGKEAQENLKKLSDNLRKKQDISKEIEILKSYKGKEIEDAILVLLKQFNKENLWQD